MTISEIIQQIISVFGNIWFLIFLLFFIIPLLQRYSLNLARQNILQKIGNQRKSEVITLIHRQETFAFFGIPISRYIDIDDSEEILRAIRMTPPSVPIDLIMHTPGGIALAATQIAMALKEHPAKKTVIIPHYAMSGGTLIALAADEILLDPHAVMGPIDPQLADMRGAYPAASILKVLETKKPEDIDDRTIILAAEAKKALVQMGIIVKKILAGKCGEDKADKIIEELATGKYTHDHPIFPDEAMALIGGCVKKEIPQDVYTLMRYYRMETRPRRPGVEYVPVMPR